MRPYRKVLTRSFSTLATRPSFRVSVGPFRPSSPCCSSEMVRIAFVIIVSLGMCLCGIFPALLQLREGGHLPEMVRAVAIDEQQLVRAHLLGRVADVGASIVHGAV